MNNATGWLIVFVIVAFVFGVPYLNRNRDRRHKEDTSKLKGEHHAHPEKESDHTSAPAKEPEHAKKTHDDHSGGHAAHGPSFGGKLANLLFWALALIVLSFVAFWIWGAGGRSVYLDVTGQTKHVAHAYQPMNQTRAPELTTSGTASVSSAVLQKEIDVPPHNKGFSESIGFPPDGIERSICRSREPEQDGFDVQYRDAHYDDEDDAHFVDQLDQIPNGRANAERYRSKDDVGFKMRVWLVNAGHDCGEYHWVE